MAKPARENTSAVIRAVLRKNKPTGMTPGDIRRVLGEQVVPKYLYKALARMRRAGSIKLADGKYHVTEPTTPPKAMGKGTKVSKLDVSESRGTKDGLDHELIRMKRDFDEYIRGYRDGWSAGSRSSNP